MIYRNYQVVADVSDPIRQFAEHARDIRSGSVSLNSQTPIDKL